MSRQCHLLPAPAGTIRCLLCEGIVGLDDDGGLEKYETHLKTQHGVYHNRSWLMQQTLNCVEKISVNTRNNNAEKEVEDHEYVSVAKYVAQNMNNQVVGNFVAVDEVLSDEAVEMPYVASVLEVDPITVDELVAFAADDDPLKISSAKKRSKQVEYLSNGACKSQVICEGYTAHESELNFKKVGSTNSEEGGALLEERRYPRRKIKQNTMLKHFQVKSAKKENRTLNNAKGVQCISNDNFKETEAVTDGFEDNMNVPKIRKFAVNLKNCKVKEVSKDIPDLNSNLDLTFVSSSFSSASKEVSSLGIPKLTRLERAADIVRPSKLNLDLDSLSTTRRNNRSQNNMDSLHKHSPTSLLSSASRASSASISGNPSISSSTSPSSVPGCEALDMDNEQTDKFVYVCPYPNCDFHTDLQGMKTGPAADHGIEVHHVTPWEVKKHGLKWKKTSLEKIMRKIFGDA